MSATLHGQPQSALRTLRIFLTEIRIEHTLFALPFAYVGALIATHGLPTMERVTWITLAVLGARTAAMSANRYIDRDIDARNPRTAGRGLVRAAIAPHAMLWGGAVGLAVLVIAAFALNPLCVTLLPVAALGIIVYPFCKRFTWGTHFVLGAVDGLAPLGACIAISNTITLPALLLFTAVTLWVAGFDIIYALMDYDIDVQQNIHSIPARFGVAHGRALPIALHLLVMPALLAVGPLAHVHPAYYIGALCVLPLTWYENRLFDITQDVFTLNQRVFKANMIFSLVFLATTVMGYVP